MDRLIDGWMDGWETDGMLLSLELYVSSSPGRRFYFSQSIRKKDCYDYLTVCPSHFTPHLSSCEYRAPLGSLSFSLSLCIFMLSLSLSVLFAMCTMQAGSIVQYRRTKTWGWAHSCNCFPLRKKWEKTKKKTNVINWLLRKAKHIYYNVIRSRFSFFVFFRLFFLASWYCNTATCCGGGGRCYSSF